MPDARTPRDRTLSAAGYRDFIERYEEHVRHALSKGAPTLFDPVARYTLEISSALYSTGAPVPDCLRQLDEMATYDLRYIAEGRKYAFVGIGPVEHRFVERFPAAHLVGRSGELVSAHRRCTFECPLQPWEKGLLTPICSVLVGDPVKTDAAAEAAIRKAVKYLAAVPRLCQTVSDRDPIAFASTLEEFLNEGWGPVSKRRAKTALKAKPHDYAGMWSFLAAALCRIMGGVPDIPASAVKYIPVELVAK